jgi:3-oxoacyl-[acyl-carrier-protein] synthase II
MGCVTPVGNSAESYWDALVQGVSGVRLISRFDPERFACRLAAEVDSDQLPRWRGRYAHELRRTDPFVRYALAASEQAFADAAVTPEAARQRSGGLFFGVAMGGLGSIEAGVLLQEASGPRKTSPYLIPSLIPNMAASMVALRLGLDAPQQTFVGGCASGLQAIGEAAYWIGHRGLDWALCGGAEAVITPITYSGFQAMGALSPATEWKPTPKAFDRSRDGMVVGEGAAMLLVEELETARRRGARIYAEVTGFATRTVTQQAFVQHSGETTRCMEDTLHAAGVEPAEVGCVYAHAGGLAGDASEMQALDAVFSDRGCQPLVTSTKGSIGYTFGACGPLDTVAAAMAIHTRTVSPTLYFEATEPEYERLQVVAETTAAEVDHCLVNSFGLGGVTSSLLLSRHRDDRAPRTH